MANELSDDQKQALWLLHRMRDSEEFLNLMRKARAEHHSDPLDTPDRIERHSDRLAPLYQGEVAQEVELPEKLAGLLTAAGLRDLLSCPEELIEKALAAYIKLSPKGDDDLPGGWPSTFSLAEDEIKGVTKGNFGPGFVAMLAGRAREEQQRSGPQPERGNGLERE